MFRNYITILVELREWETNWRNVSLEENVFGMLTLLNLHGYIIDTRNSFFLTLNGMLLNEEITHADLSYYMRESRRPYKSR